MEEMLFYGWDITPKKIVAVQKNVWRVDHGSEQFALKQSLLKEITAGQTGGAVV